MVTRFRTFYGAHPLHLLAVLAGFALLGYTVSVAGPAALWNPSVWWQSILVWFLGAVVLHALRARIGHRDRPPRVSAVNYLRVPVLASGLLFLVFFPGIIAQGASTYLAATGQTQAPFLGRWLLLTAIAFALSALAYTTHLALAHRKAGSPSSAATADGGSADGGAHRAVVEEPRA